MEAGHGQKARKDAESQDEPRRRCDHAQLSSAQTVKTEAMKCRADEKQDAGTV